MNELYIYLVMGRTSEKYTGASREWPVAGYFDPSHADVRVNELKELCQAANGLIPYELRQLQGTIRSAPNGDPNCEIWDYLTYRIVKTPVYST